MKPTEHQAKAQTSQAGFFAALCVLLRAKGGSAPSRSLAAVLATIAAVLVGMLLLAAPASDLAATTCKPPVLDNEPEEEHVHATRVFIYVHLETGGCEVEGRAEYATSESGPWTFANEETFTPEGETTFDGKPIQLADNIFAGQLGAANGQDDASPVLHHLVPATPYFVRFIVKNHEGGKAVKTFAFNTTAVTKPEIAEQARANHHTTFSLVQGEDRLTHTSAAFTADIEGNGAATEYHFEYAESSNGPWKSFTSGGGGSVSVAEDFAEPEAKLTGLTPETTYYVRVRASNEKGEVEQTKYTVPGAAEPSSFTTRTAKPVIASVPDVLNVTGTAAHLDGSLQPNGSETNWQFEYAKSVSGPWSAVPGGAGTVSQAEAEALGETGSVDVEGALAGLSPATAYYVRLSADNKAGAGEDCYYSAGGEVCGPIQSAGFETSGPPTAATFATHALHGESVRLLGAVDPGSTPTSAEQVITVGGSPTGGTFTLTFKGQSITATGTGDLAAGSKEVTGLVTETGVFGAGEPISGQGIPAGTTISAAHPESLMLSQAATEEVSGATLTAGLNKLPFDATAEEVEKALRQLSGIGSGSTVTVRGPTGGPYRVFFGGHDGEVSQPLIEANSSGLSPSGSVTVTTAQPGGVGYEAHYHFEYLTEAQFDGEGGFSGPATKSTPEIDIGSGNTDEFVGEDLSALQAGKIYRYRLVATNDSPGDPVVDGAEHTFQAPTLAPAEESGACPNERFRTGPAAELPDCRAYEQLTPLNKEGAEEIFGYGENTSRGAVAGEDGNGLVYEDKGTVNWDPGAGQGPYFFSRQEGEGWQVTAGSPQPETGPARPEPQLYDAADLSRFAFESGYNTGPEGESKEVQFKVGVPGGPYTTVASVPRSQVGEAGKWVAASADFSKLILQVEDHKSLTGATGTLSGYDLYEYANGELRQVNVESDGKKLGTCGAKIVQGSESEAPDDANAVSSSHAVSADGARVFFEAVPGSKCSEPTNLYMREDGERTLDIGAYQFLAANGEGNEVLLGKRVGESLEVFLYNAQTATVSSLISLLGGESLHVDVSEDLGAIYFQSHAQMPGTEAPPIADDLGDNVTNIYRYDIPTKALSFVAQAASTSISSGKITAQLTPDGHYYYFEAQAVGAVPGGRDAQEDGQMQIYRYDSAEDVIQCMSCASPFDSEPTLSSFFGRPTEQGRIAATDNASVSTLVSGNGDFAFFYTASALLPADVDGESAPTPDSGEFESISYSPSTDVYEWREDGVDGCSQLQGCLALITTGEGGDLNILIGSAEEGRDVFFASASKLVPQDDDSTLNIYDARVDGGFAPPAPRPVECEGDACSTPAGSPIDSTPSSLTFSGAGNLAPVETATLRSTKKTTKKATKKKRKAGKRSGKKQKRGLKSKRRVTHVGNDRRARR